MKKLLYLFSFSLIFLSCKNETKEVEEDIPTAENLEVENETSVVDIDPISHASAIVEWDDAVFYLDPTGGAEAYEGKADADLVMITDIHGDHMNAETLKALELGETKIIAPQAVKDELPEEMGANIIVMNNGETQNIMGFTIEAIPMYNLPEGEADTYHPKGRGNGYIIEKDGKRLYISGDTEAIPEMRNLQNIDMALVAMNLPYTMDVDQAAEGVTAFAPEKVYPYHYRGGEGLSDVDKFKQMINEKNADIEVVQLDWYPDME